MTKKLLTTDDISQLIGNFSISNSQENDTTKSSIKKDNTSKKETGKLNNEDHEAKSSSTTHRNGSRSSRSGRSRRVIDVAKLTDTATLDLSDDLKAKSISIRCIVSTKDAGALIGKAGIRVKNVRDVTGVKAGVSKIIEEANERILTVTGTLDNISKAYALFAEYLIENNNLINSKQFENGQSGFKYPTHKASIHILVSHLLMGSIIGKNGENIKQIQEKSSAYIVASKDMLPQSTERVIEIIGSPDSIHVAIYHIIVAILRDFQRSVNVILFQPSPKYDISSYMNISSQNRNSSDEQNSHAHEEDDHTNKNKNRNGNKRNSVHSEQSNSSSDNSASTQPLTFKVPANFVGCTIGKKGSKIAEIRRISGSKISISPPNADNSGERTFTITGTEKAKEKALSLIYELLQAEKERLEQKEKQRQQHDSQNEDQTSEEKKNLSSTNDTEDKANPTN